MDCWIDTHCHLDAPEFAADAGSVRARAVAAGVVHCVIPAVDTGNFGAVQALAHQYGDSYALGIHPMRTATAADADLAELESALHRHRDDPRLVAVGEIGLDFFVEGLDREHQEQIYRAQLRLAAQAGLPVILHVRRSADRLLSHLRAVGVTGGIAHAFNGSDQQARAFVDLGFKLGFGGAVTFERALQLRRLAISLPASALVLETDSPDIPPQWLYRTAVQRAGNLTQGRNEPAELPRIAAVIAGLRGASASSLAEQTLENALVALPRLAALLNKSAPAAPATRSS